MSFFDYIELATIAFDDSQGATGEAISRRLLALGACKSLSLSINSDGGSDDGMWDILLTLGKMRRSGTEITAHIDFAGSAAAAVALAADRRIIAAGGAMMIHRGKCPRCPSCDCRESDRLYGEYIATATGNRFATVERWVDQETWFDHREALRYGFATHLSPIRDVRFRRDLTGRNRP